MSSYLADNVGVFPPSYVYPYDAEGNYDLDDQPLSHPYGYVHWSWFLYSSGQATDDAFACPSMQNGGAPRTNPGPRDWEDGQVDQNGQSGPNSLEDKQAPRMAYTGNAAIFPRNKFTNALSGGPRVNKCVNETEIFDPARVVLATEWNDNWQATGVIEGGGVLVKSHRPVNPFWHIGSGSDEYGAPLGSPGFTYGDGPHFGVKPRSDVTDVIGLIDNPGIPEVNAVGRHHRGGDAYSGGAVNFLYADMHVEKKSVLETMRKREWGLRYYAIDGENKVGPPW